jgi:hypothetical protein
MKDLSPYPSQVPLSAGARFVRGFRRVGAVIAVLAALVGVGITITVAWTAEDSAQRRWEQARCLIQKYPDANKVPIKQYSSSIDFYETGCSGPLYYETIETVATIAHNKPTPLAALWEPLAAGLAITTAVASMIYVAPPPCSGGTPP